MVFALHKESQSTSQISWNKFSPTPLPRRGLIKICNKFEVCLKYTFLPISKKRASPITMSKIVPVVLSTPHIMHRITKPKPKFATSGLYPERRRSLEELEINLNLNKCSLFPWVALTPECDISVPKLFHILDALASLRSILFTDWLSDNFRLLMFYYCIFQIFY